MAAMILRDPSFVMFDNFAARRYYDDYKSCETVDVPKKYFPVPVSFIAPKESPYFEAFLFHMRRMKERGVLGRILEGFEPKEGQNCPDYSGKALGFRQSFAAFLMLSAAFLTAFFISLCEVMTFNGERRPR